MDGTGDRRLGRRAPCTMFKRAVCPATMPNIPKLCRSGSGGSTACRRGSLHITPPPTRSPTTVGEGWVSFSVAIGSVFLSLNACAHVRAPQGGGRRGGTRVLDGVEPGGPGPARAIALLAHELRHGQELAEAEWVRSDDDVRRFFPSAPDPLGKGDGERTLFETPAAIDAQLRVERAVLAVQPPG